MSKDSYWFRHDSTAGRTLRMRKMAHIYGHEGKGFYWDVVEILRDQDGYQFQCDDSSLQLLCDLIGCKDEIRFLNWFKDCEKLDLLRCKDGYFICPALSDNMKFWEKQKANGGKGGRPKKTQTKPKLKPKKNHNSTVQYRTEQDITNKFNAPAVFEISEYAKELNYHSFNSEAFHAYYESNGWKVGKNKMKDWRAAVRGWYSRDKSKNEPEQKLKYLN